MDLILKSIQELKKNKFNYTEYEYKSEIIRLYEKMSDYNKIRDDINNNLKTNNEVKLNEYDLKLLTEEIMIKDNSEKIFSTKNFNKIYQLNGLFKILLLENNLIKLDNTNENNFLIQTIPITEKNYDKQKIVYHMKLYLHLTNILTGQLNKCIMAIIIYDMLLRNFKFVTDHENFKNTVKLKLQEFSIDENKNKFTEVAEKYNLNRDFFDKWKKLFEELN